MKKCLWYNLKGSIKWKSRTQNCLDAMITSMEKADALEEKQTTEIVQMLTVLMFGPWDYGWLTLNIPPCICFL